MKVKDCMNPRAVAVGAFEPVAVAARVMARQNVGMLPVRDASGRLVGVVTDRDIAVRCVAAGQDAARLRVQRVMSTRPVSVTPETDVCAAAALLAREQVRRLPVVENGRLCGMVSLADLARSADYSMEAAECLEKICTNVRSGAKTWEEG